MRTRSKAKGPANARKGAAKTVTKSDVVEIEDDVQPIAQDQTATTESAVILDKKQDTEVVVSVSETLVQGPVTAAADPVIAAEEPATAAEEGRSEASAEDKPVSDLKPEANQMDVNSASEFCAIGESVCKVESSVSDGIVAVILNEETMEVVKGVPVQPELTEDVKEVRVLAESTEEIKEVPESTEEVKEVPVLAKSTEEIKEVPDSTEEVKEVPVLAEQTITTIKEEIIIVKDSVELARETGKEDIEVIPEAKIKTSPEENEAVEEEGQSSKANEVMMSAEANEAENKDGQSLKADEVMSEVLEVQVNQGIDEPTFNKGEESGMNLETMVEVGDGVVERKEPELADGPELAEAELGTGAEGQIQGDGEDIVKRVEGGADNREEYPDVQQSLPIFERQRRKRLEVFVGGIEKEATEDDIKEVFQKAGEVTEVRLMKNPQTGKNKGYAFVRYATLEEAKRAASELDRVEIRGKSCGVLPSDENDTLFLGNINKSWKREAVMEKLTSYGVESMEEMTLMEDPQMEGSNRGFAFLEFTTHKDALKAFKCLQQPDAIFGAEKSAKVAWAQPLNEPDEEAMAQVKSVFVDGMPPAWDEEKVKEHFGRYGDIEKVVLARSMSSAKRKDFGFVNFATREAALACIEALNDVEIGIEGDTKIKFKVMLAKPQTKTKPFKGGVRGGFPVQSRESKPAGGGEGGHGRGAVASSSRGGRGSGRGGRGVMSRGIGGRQIAQHHFLHPTMYAGRAPGGYALAGGNVRGGYARHYDLIHPMDPWRVGPGSFGEVYAGRGGYATNLPSREGFQAQPYVQTMNRNFPSGYNRGMAAAAAAVREYGVAVPGVKRAYSAVEDPRYTDASIRHSRARVDSSTEIGGSQHARASASRASQLASLAQQPGLVGGTYASGSHVHNAAYPASYLASSAEMRGDPLHPAVYGASSGSGGYNMPGNGTGAYY